jgi:ATP phosphoribosyltransferase
VEVTETGTTIKAHGLRIIAELLVTSTRLIANKQAWEDPWKKHKIQQMNVLLQGALRAEKMVGLKMNVRESDLDVVLKLLPSITSPTMAGLRQKGWVSIEIIVDENIVRDLVPELMAIGVEGIIEYPLNKVI